MNDVFFAIFFSPKCLKEKFPEQTNIVPFQNWEVSTHLTVTFGAEKALSHKAKNDLTERVAYEIRAKVPF